MRMAVLTELHKMEYFGTLTLPPCHYRKTIRGQLKVMLGMLVQIHKSCFDTFYGVAEITVKGNVHLHYMCTLRPDILQSFPVEDHRRFYVYDLIKQYCVNDFQKIKDISKVYNYIHKDIEKTYALMNSLKNVKMNIIFRKQSSHVHLPIEELAQNLSIEQLEKLLAEMEYMDEHFLKH